MMLGSVCKRLLRRFSGLFWPLFDFLSGGNINIRILTPGKKIRKSAQKNPKIDRRIFCKRSIKLLCCLCAFNFLHGNESNFSTLEEEYTPKYCLQLEAAYGEGMMSEGGGEAVEYMFDALSLEKKTALDIGSGLGGVPFYLADKHSMKVTGLEVNGWMVAESKRRTPVHLQGEVDFYLSTNNNNWPFSDESFDIVYSKGVLTHVEAKDELFQECHRILKKGGHLVITDWLSSEERKWGENIARLVELENLVLFPESKTNYIELLQKNGFKLISVRDDSAVYHRFNLQIVDRLRTDHSNLFDEAELQASIDGYESIAKALEVGELKVFRFVVTKEN